MHILVQKHKGDASKESFGIRRLRNREDPKQFIGTLIMIMQVHTIFEVPMLSLLSGSLHFNFCSPVIFNTNVDIIKYNIFQRELSQEENFKKVMSHKALLLFIITMKRL